MLHKSSYTETQLAEMKYKFKNNKTCDKCGELLAVYQNHLTNKWLFLDEGTLEVHTCS